MRILYPLICCAILFLDSCNHAQHEEHEEAIFVVTNPVSKDTLIYNEYVCQIHSIQHIELQALEKGYLQEIYVDEGQRVHKGDLLFKILPVIYKSEVQKAAAEVKFVELEFLNTKSLADSNIVSMNELALAQATLQKAQAELALAQAHLDFTEIRAPFDGIIGRFNDVRHGSLVDEGDLLTTLSDNSMLWVYFNVPEAEYLDYATRVKPDSLVSVKLQMANNQLYGHDGIVETIEADFNNETGNIAFRATFKNPNGLLRNGETGNILMPVRLKNALLIPQKATYEILDKKFVFVVDENDVVQSREIHIGEEMPHVYTVIDGIKETDKILVDGLRKVKSGQKIHYRMLDFKHIITESMQLHAE